MAKNIYKIVIMAAIALTLTVGSALADPLWADFTGYARLYDKSGEFEITGDDVFNAYWIEFWLTGWEDYSDIGGSTILPTGPVKFQFRESDDPESEDAECRKGSGLCKGFKPYYTGNVIFELDIDGFSFTADAYQDWETVLFLGTFGDATLDMDLLGWINEEVSVEYAIKLDWYDGCVTPLSEGTPSEGDNLMCNKWNMIFETSFDSLPDTPAVPEPGTMLLLGTGLLGVAIAARRKMKK